MVMRLINDNWESVECGGCASPVLASLPSDYKPYNPPPFGWPEGMIESFVWARLRPQFRDLCFFVMGLGAGLAWWMT